MKKQYTLKSTTTDPLDGVMYDKANKGLARQSKNNRRRIIRLLARLDDVFEAENEHSALLRELEELIGKLGNSDHIYFGLPEPSSPVGLYFRDKQQYLDSRGSEQAITWAIFSDLKVAKKGLSKTHHHRPIFYGVMSRMKFISLSKYLALGRILIDYVSSMNITRLDIETGLSSITRLGRRAGTYGILLVICDILTELGCAWRINESNHLISVLGQFMMSQGLHSERWKQSVVKVNKYLSYFLAKLEGEDHRNYCDGRGEKHVCKSFEEIARIVRSSISDLLNQKGTYNAHVTLKEYARSILKELDKGDLLPIVDPRIHDILNDE